ncbi:conserved hypothetical protein [Methanocaldococcus vulcanius M7]|uniref:DUF2341 domain-containing protein n=1 Tax=Methanocaldococcus vulcanius (strain ATCC 700851 / DSM 12094 / M7) TaxID=579137 RepID=C9RFD4_METVM|nr:hypothetical protein [Methanocaldococcus vulcanius]ACX72286.1 conserved hypothetical protein [Methanocaldococcus vulcanius M7]
MAEVNFKSVNLSIALCLVLIMFLLMISNVSADNITVFYDNFENWTGWANYSYGIVEQSSTVSHSGNYSLEKYGNSTSNNDPSGGYKNLSNPVGRDIVVSGWIYRVYPYTGGRWDRIGIEDSNFDGYSIRIEHDYNKIAIEKRVGGITVSTLALANWDPPENQWYYFKFYVLSNGTLRLEVYNASGALEATVSTVDTTYNKFDRVVIHGGYIYYVDDLEVEYLHPLKVEYLEEYNINATVDGSGKTNYNPSLTGHFIIKNTAPYIEDTLNNVWIAINLTNNASGLRVIYNGTPKGVFIKSSAPAYTNLPQANTYVFIPVLPNNSYVELAYDISASDVIPVLINETYQNKIPANRLSNWSVNLTVYLNKNIIPNGTNVNINIVKYLSNGQFYDNFENWTGWMNYSKGAVKQSSTVSHSGNYSLEKYLNYDPNGGYKKLPAVIGRDVIVKGWIYRPSNWGGGPIDRIGLEDSNFNGYSFEVNHYSNYISIDRRTNGNPTEISQEVLWNPPEDQWYYFELKIYSNGTITFSTYYQNGTLAATVSTVDTTYNKFDRVVVHGGYIYYVDDLEVDSKNFNFYGNKNWSYLKITSTKPSVGSVYTFDGDYFKKDYNTSIPTALNWSNISLNWSKSSANLIFNISGNFTYANRSTTKVDFGFAKIIFNYNGTHTNTSIEGVYASGNCMISTSHGITGEINVWTENASFKNTAKSYSFNITGFKIWAVNKSAYDLCYDPFNTSILINGSNYSLQPNVIISAGDVWNSPTFNFTFNGVPIVWANFSFSITKDGYSITQETSQMGSSYIIVEEIYVVGSYLVKVTKHIVPNADGSYDVYIVVENIGSEKTPNYVYVYDLIPKNFTVSDEWVNRSTMLIANGSKVLTSNPRYNLSMWWALKSIYPGADGDGSYTDWNEIQNNQTVVIHYKLNGTGEFYPSDAFIVGIDPTNSLLPTTSPKITTVTGDINNNTEPLLALTTLLTTLTLIIRRLT